MTNDHQGVILDVANDYQILDCQNCGFKHALITQELNDIYTSHYYETEKPEYILFNENDSDWWKFNYSERILKIDSLMNFTASNWLDIGTGPGLFLDTLKSTQRVGTGIEPSLLAYNHAISKGHNVINGFFDYKKSTELGQFDAIHLSEVLEHIPEPIEFLENVVRVLRPGGHVCIVVPNDYSVIQEIFVKNTKEEKWWIQPPFHINYFNKESLGKLITSVGLSVEHITTNFPIDFFLLMGDMYIGDPKVGKSAHERRKRFEKSFQDANHLDFLRVFYTALADLGIGRELILYAKKPE
jgi:SAM-dependent methyltransferase